MSRHEEHERVRRRLGGLAVRERGRPSSQPPRESGRGSRTADSRVDDDAGQWDEDELAPSSGPPGAVATPVWLDDGASGGRNRLVPERFREARLDPGRRGAIVLGLVGVIAVVLTGVIVLRDQPVARAVPPVPALRAESIAVQADPTVAVAAVSGRGPSTSAEVVVSVVGLVERAGLHRLPDGSRIADALEEAGGTREGADLAGLNLAQRLSDGDQVVVGATDPQVGQPRLGSIMIGAGRAAPPAPNSAGPSRVGSDSAGPSTGGGTGAKSRLDLNTATEAELDALPGVGPVTAKAILAWRSANGRFTDVAQLGEVDGIGPARLARLRELVTT
ncbi:ComEA family DNA-binding protein [Nocardia salmonicida]|uniref:ComEA family DNA-binding protein n=1 Tax=Nocardia salmonicida TaxID=53431 RepID=UPI000A059C16|nr:ComEA family DNA-binding protein [Nocardia salmonicida]